MFADMPREHSRAQQWGYRGVVARGRPAASTCRLQGKGTPVASRRRFGAHARIQLAIISSADLSLI
jgi:hypothetical protein